MADWQETGTVAEGCVVAFEGVNQDEQDALEMENFARGLKTPAKEDPGGKAFARTSRVRAQAMTPMDAVRFGLGLVCGLGGYYGLDALGVEGGALMGGGFGFFMVGVLLPSMVALVRTRQAQPVARTTRDAFRLTISGAELSVEGERMGRQVFAMESIDRVEGVGRLTVHRRDGSSVALACGLKSRMMHGALAARLTELVREAKALRGYR